MKDDSNFHGRASQEELERIFYHDIINSISGLIGSCKLLSRNKTDPDKLNEYSSLIEKLSLKLDGEIRLQQKLTSIKPTDFDLAVSSVEIRRFLKDMASLAGYHPAAKKRSIITVDPLPELYFKTDESLLGRVVMNMLINACEASGEKETIKLWAEHQGDAMSIKVWNRRAIDPKVALRIFQRHFSTKDGMGRGFGTYSMKLIGETALKGKVEFKSNETEGTTFSIKLNIQ